MLPSNRTASRVALSPTSTCAHFNNVVRLSTNVASFPGLRPASNRSLRILIHTGKLGEGLGARLQPMNIQLILAQQPDSQVLFYSQQLYKKLAKGLGMN